jgi:hypothetical protein
MQRIRTIAVVVAPLLIVLSRSSAAQEAPWRWAFDVGVHSGIRPVPQTALAIAASGRIVRRQYWDARIEAGVFPTILHQRTRMICIPPLVTGGGTCREIDNREMSSFATSTLMITAGPARRNLYAVAGLGAYAGRWAENSGGGKGPSAMLADVGVGGFLRTGMFDADRVKLEARVRMFANTNRLTVPGVLLTAGYAR